MKNLINYQYQFYILLSDKLMNTKRQLNERVSIWNN